MLLWKFHRRPLRRLYMCETVENFSERQNGHAVQKGGLEENFTALFGEQSMTFSTRGVTRLGERSFRDYTMGKLFGVVLSLESIFFVCFKTRFYSLDYSVSFFKPLCFRIETVLVLCGNPFDRITGLSFVRLNNYIYGPLFRVLTQILPDRQD